MDSHSDEEQEETPTVAGMLEAVRMDGDLDAMERYRQVMFHADTMTPGEPPSDDTLIAALMPQEHIEGAVLNPLTGEMVAPMRAGLHTALVNAAAATQRVACAPGFSCNVCCIQTTALLSEARWPPPRLA